MSKHIKHQVGHTTSRVQVAIMAQRAVPQNRAMQMADDCNHILDKDETFAENYRHVRDQFTSGAVAPHTFRNVVRYQINRALERAGLPPRTAKLYCAMVAPVAPVPLRSVNPYALAAS